MMTDTPPYSSITAIGDDIGRLINGHIDLAFRVILRGSHVTHEPRFSRLITGEAHPFGNFSMLSVPADVANTKAAMEPLTQLAAPAAMIFTSAVPQAVIAQLNAEGFQAHDSMPAMGVDIETLPPTTLPAGYTFARYGDGSEAQLWAEAFADGYELPRLVGAEFKPFAADRVTDPNSPMQYFAILKDGKPVCTSLVYLKNGVAGIYGVATLPSERGKGLGAHVTAEPLRLAHALGYRVGILQSSPAGYPVYRKLGFKDFGELPLYVRIPE